MIPHGTTEVRNRRSLCRTRSVAAQTGTEFCMRTGRPSPAKAHCPVAHTIAGDPYQENTWEPEGAGHRTGGHTWERRRHPPLVSALIFLSLCAHPDVTCLRPPQDGLRWWADVCKGGEDVHSEVPMRSQGGGNYESLPRYLCWTPVSSCTSKVVKLNYPSSCVISTGPHCSLRVVSTGPP